MGVHVVGLVKDVPYMNTTIVRKPTHHSLNVSLQRAVEVREVEDCNSRRLNPSAVVNEGHWRPLRSEARIGVPARIEENEHHLDIVLGCNA